MNIAYRDDEQTSMTYLKVKTIDDYIKAFDLIVSKHPKNELLLSELYYDMISELDRDENEEGFQEIESKLEKLFPSELPKFGEIAIGYKVVVIKSDPLYTIPKNEGEGIIYSMNLPGIAKLIIPEDAMRLQSFNRKCRCDHAIVDDIRVRIDGKIMHAKRGFSPIYNRTFRDCTYNQEIHYTVGFDVIPDGYTNNRWIECSNGIHFFMTPEEAVDFACRNYIPGLATYFGGNMPDEKQQMLEDVYAEKEV